MMNEKRADQQRAASVPDRIEQAGGLNPGVSRQVADETGVPEATVYGVGSFFHLLADPAVDVRVCQGLSCALNGAGALLQQAVDSGVNAAGCSCLAVCDQPVPLLKGRTIIPAGGAEDLTGQRPDRWSSRVGPTDVDADRLANRLHLQPDYNGSAFQRALGLGAEAVIELISDSGLQGRGGAGFPAGFKWRSVAGQAETTRYLVLNADEGEPGTFKDREVLIRRPDTVLEGLAISAVAVGASDVYCYLRGEFDRPWSALESAIARVKGDGLYPGITFHLHAGHGAYICGEETALIEALEGKRGMPRLKPPYPTESGLWGKPTLVHNVETIACVPAIVEGGAEWFRDLGRTGSGTKLYSISGHVRHPGVYELPLGVNLDELVEAAGGYLGELKAFSPGGASSGFLPAAERTRALDFKSLTEVGSMLGSAGVVVLNQSVDMVWAVRQQLLFFEAESCGQCAPCRIGTRFLREALDRTIAGESASKALAQVDDVAWQMNEGSICGLGMTAPLPLTSALKWFPEEFSR